MSSKKITLSSKDVVKNQESMHSIAFELQRVLENNIDATVKHQAVAGIIKSSILVRVLGDNHAVITLHAVRPSIYNEVGINGGYADLVDVYNYGSHIRHNPYFFKPGSKGFYLKDKGFSFEGGYFLEKTVADFSASHPDCNVSLSH